MSVFQIHYFEILSVSVVKRSPIDERPDGSKFATVTFKVRTRRHVDTGAGDPTIDGVPNATGIPRANITRHVDNVSLLCTHRTVDYVDDSFSTFIVTAHFDTRQSSSRPDPEESTPRVTGSIRAYTEDRPVFFDSFGQPLVNSAGDYYEGQTRKHRLRAYNVSAQFLTIPDELFELAGTCNDQAITIHGKTYPAYTCLLDSVDMPPEPERYGETQFWRISYQILVDPDGWTRVLPDRGYHEIDYRTRESEGGPWESVSHSTYEAETNANLKDKVKVAITDGTDGPVASNIWLDQHGQAILASLDSKTLSTTFTTDDTTLEINSGSATKEDIGKMIVVKGAGLAGRDLQTVIKNVTNGDTIIEIEGFTSTEGTTALTYIGGAFAKEFAIEKAADWSNLPLPNNHVAVS